MGDCKSAMAATYRCNIVILKASLTSTGNGCIVLYRLLRAASAACMRTSISDIRITSPGFSISRLAGSRHEMIRGRLVKLWVFVDSSRWILAIFLVRAPSTGRNFEAKIFLIGPTLDHTDFGIESLDKAWGDLVLRIQ